MIALHAMQDSLSCAYRLLTVRMRAVCEILLISLSAFTNIHAIHRNWSARKLFLTIHI